jgi:hypothetical protein
MSSSPKDEFTVEVIETNHCSELRNLLEVVEPVAEG